jgi:hypothetical protein
VQEHEPQGRFDYVYRFVADYSGIYHCSDRQQDRSQPDHDRNIFDPVPLRNDHAVCSHCFVDRLLAVDEKVRLIFETLGNGD